MTREVYDLLDQNDRLEALAKGAELVRFNIKQFPSTFGIVSGGAKGPDTWAAQAAEDLGLELVVYPAEWDKYGRGAGRLRNKLIAQHADSCLVFWDGDSRGTKDFLTKAFKLRREIWLIGPSGTPWAIWDEDYWKEVDPKKPPRMDIPGL